MSQTVSDYLIALYNQLGVLTPELVVEDAKRKDSPLHEMFEWDVNKAAYAHWENVARQLIRSVQVNIVHESKVLRAPFFVRDSSLPTNQQGYASIDRVRMDAEMARDTVADECARAAAAFRRASAVAAAVGVDQDVRDLLDQTLMLGGRVKEPDAA